MSSTRQHQSWTLEELVELSYAEVADHHLRHLQDVLEALAAQLKKHRRKIISHAGRASCRNMYTHYCAQNTLLTTSHGAFAGTHKEQVRLNRKISTDRQEIVDVLKQYNQLLPFGQPLRSAATAQQIEAAEFPWVDEPRTGKTISSLKLCFCGLLSLAF